MKNNYWCPIKQNEGGVASPMSGRVIVSATIGVVLLGAVVFGGMVCKREQTLMSVVDVPRGRGWAKWWSRIIESRRSDNCSGCDTW